MSELRFLFPLMAGYALGWIHARRGTVTDLIVKGWRDRKKAEDGKLWRISQAVQLQSDPAQLQQFYDYVKGIVEG